MNTRPFENAEERIQIPCISPRPAEGWIARNILLMRFFVCVIMIAQGVSATPGHTPNETIPLLPFFADLGIFFIWLALVLTSMEMLFRVISPRYRRDIVTTRAWAGHNRTELEQANASLSQAMVPFHTWIPSPDSIQVMVPAARDGRLAVLTVERPISSVEYLNTEGTLVSFPGAYWDNCGTFRPGDRIVVS